MRMTSVTIGDEGFEATVRGVNFRSTLGALSSVAFVVERSSDGFEVTITSHYENPHAHRTSVGTIQREKGRLHFRRRGEHRGWMRVLHFGNNTLGFERARELLHVHSKGEETTFSINGRRVVFDGDIITFRPGVRQRFEELVERATSFREALRANSSFNRVLQKQKS